MRGYAHVHNLSRQITQCASLFAYATTRISACFFQNYILLKECTHPDYAQVPTLTREPAAAASGISIAFSPFAADSYRVSHTTNTV